MLPKPVICRRCGGFTGEHQFTEQNVSEILGAHQYLEDCIENINAKIDGILDRLKYISFRLKED